MEGLIDLTMSGESDDHNYRRWEDMSDDETVHQTNTEDNNKEWQIAT